MAELKEKKERKAHKECDASKLVYTPEEVMKMLSLSKTTTYKFLNDAYEKQSPFKVVKIQSVIRVPKEGFDLWLKIVS